MRHFLALFLLTLSVVGTATLARAEECGEASWYAIRARTASGEMMNPDTMTAAHPTLPFGTVVRVVNQKNGREALVVINDRGPFTRKRVIDVSRAAAEQLGFHQAGHTQVCLTKS